MRLCCHMQGMVSRKEKAQVGTISAHNDETIGEVVADAMEKPAPNHVTAKAIPAWRPAAQV